MIFSKDKFNCCVGIFEQLLLLRYMYYGSLVHNSINYSMWTSAFDKRNLSDDE